jgi:multidrug efflux system membrane fusion protein
MPKFLVTAGSALIAVFALVGCDRPQQQPQAAPPPPAVTVATPVKQTVVDTDEYVGRFVAMDFIEVRARVSGYLEGIHFKDGQIVKQGDYLFTIDKRSFQNTLDQARANLAQTRANLAFTEQDLLRAQTLFRDRTVSEQVLDQRLQAKRIAEASVAANEAAVRQAELDVQFTELRAPVTGRIGDRRVSPGNLVIGGSQGQTTLLATIVSQDPIRFEFTFDEASLLRYVRAAKNGAKDPMDRGASTPVSLKLIDEKEFMHKGKMDFVDNVIDTSSGTIRARAVFDNPDGVLTPGMFGRVQVPGSSPYEALLVPDAAIGTEQVRKFVLVVDAENTARQKYVTLGQLSNGLRVIKEGLTPEDRVVVNGIARVRPGQKVTPQEQEKPAATGQQAQN